MKSIASRTALVVAGLVVALAGTLTLSAYAQPGITTKQLDNYGAKVLADFGVRSPNPARSRRESLRLRSAAWVGDSIGLRPLRS